MPKSVAVIYLIGCEESEIVKIGRTRDLKERLAAIQRMSPVRVRVLWHIESDAALESKLHKIFRFRRKYGEWFDFTGADPVALVQAAIRGEWNEDPPEGYVSAVTTASRPAKKAAPQGGPYRSSSGRIIRFAGGGPFP